MKTLAAYVVGMTLVAAGTAVAADMRMPVKAAPAPVAVAAYSWTGCYVGAGGGYGMWNQDTQAFIAPGVPFGSSNDNGGRGWFGTVQVGCDYQVSPSIVIGAFGDYDFASIKGDMVTLFAATPIVGQEKLKSSWAAGGRIGYLPWTSTQLLVYVSGGYTQARFGDINTTILFAPGTPFVTIGKKTYDGWFLGAGYEYGLTFLPGLFWKTEYRFADYGKENLTFTLGGAPVPGFSVDTHKYVQTIRSELVWRFNFGGGAVAARY
jgi:outer membrane immunogenic protein